MSRTRAIPPIEAHVDPEMEAANFTRKLSRQTSKNNTARSANAIERYLDAAQPANPH